MVNIQINDQILKLLSDMFGTMHLFTLYRFIDNSFSLLNEYTKSPVQAYA